MKKSILTLICLASSIITYAQSSQEPDIIHDTIVTIIQDTINDVKIDTIKRIEECPNQISLQLDVAPQVTCGRDNLGMGVHLTLGARMSDYCFLGFGMGFEGSLVTFGSRTSAYILQIPFYANARCYFQVKEVSPFFDFAAGLNVREQNVPNNLTKEWVCGLYTRAGFGVEWRRLIVAAGYQFTGGCSATDDNYVHQAYLKCGFRFLDRD